MNCIEILQRLGFLPKWRSSDVEAAQDEDVARSTAELNRIVDQAQSVAVRSRVANGKLLESVRRVRSSAFAELEHSVRQGGVRDR